MSKVNITVSLPRALLRKGEGDAGRARGRAVHLVRRHLQGQQGADPGAGDGAGSNHRRVSGAEAQAGRIRSLEARPAGHHRRPGAGESSTAGKSATAFRSARTSGARRTAAIPGNSTSSPSTTRAAPASTRPARSSTTTTSTSRCSTARTWCSWMVIRVANPDESDALAARIDSMFANSPFETKTVDRTRDDQAVPRADGQHRTDPGVGHHRRVLHHAARDRQHHGAVGQ